eukprot:6036489-Pyramimonas_sp.AAC.1
MSVRIQLLRIQNRPRDLAGGAENSRAYSSIVRRDRTSSQSAQQLPFPSTVFSILSVVRDRFSCWVYTASPPEIGSHAGYIMFAVPPGQRRECDQSVCQLAVPGAGRGGPPAGARL